MARENLDAFARARRQWVLAVRKRFGVGEDWRGLAHPHFECAEGMLDGLTTHAHCLRVRIETLLHRFKQVLVLPSRDPSFLGGGAVVLDGAALVGVGPVAVQDKPMFLVGEVVGEPFTGRTNVNVLFSHVAEVLLAEAPLRL